MSELRSSYLDLAHELERVATERDAYETALRDIESRDWIENALDPQWAPMRAKAALDGNPS